MEMREQVGEQVNAYISYLGQEEKSAAIYRQYRRDILRFL